ncbi:MAG: TIGR01777 family oxidoreductase [Ignavibacteriaceae bacterium]|nr:TIGR01777 family oxidoreductase [Ignavibacteriaceae bacterium]
MAKKIIITGATGFIGKKLCKALAERGDEVTIFTRSVESAKKDFPFIKNFVKWNYKNPDEWKFHIENKHAVVHLAGVNLFAKRWNEDFKKQIIESREHSTKNLVLSIKDCKNKPEVFVSASGVGYYGDSGDTFVAEESTKGNDFLSGVCEVWERESQKAGEYGIRSVQVRTGLVLSPEDGALKQMLPTFKFFVGGPLGNGKQWVSWLHIDDIVGSYIHAIDNQNLSGTVNAASPNPVKMKEFAKTLGRLLRRPSYFSVPEFVIRFSIGEAADVVLSGQRVDVTKILNSGYKFKFENLGEALNDLLK